jgi:ribosomal protein S18 acetylase RimI-like enzyme
MANHASGAEGPNGTGHRAKVLDAEILKRTIRESISTSPEAFLKTIEDVDNRASGYWQKEIDTSTWAVIQRGDEVVGIAVARYPDFEMDRNIDRTRVRFIESVWIAPGLRGGHLGERLIRYLFEAEYTKSPDIRQFMLWVLAKNRRAIRLYKRMKFRYVERQVLPDGSGRIELRYEYRLKLDARVMKSAAKARENDHRKRDMIYRVLGEETE